MRRKADIGTARNGKTKYDDKVCTLHTTQSLKNRNSKGDNERPPSEKEGGKSTLPDRKYIMGRGHTSLIRHPNARERKKYTFNETKSCKAKG